MAPEEGKMRGGEMEGLKKKHAPVTAIGLSIFLFAALTLATTSRSDWHKRFSDFEAFYNKDPNGQAHYPGWTIEALKFLFDERDVTAIGHEPIDADAAVAQKEGFFSCESYVLETNRFQVELIANLDKVPEAGALLVCSWPKPKAGSGFPARLFAIVP